MHPLDSAIESIKREFDAACAKHVTAARCQVTHELNQFVRRLRQYKSEREWASALVEGAKSVARELALFAVQNASLSLRAKSELQLPDDLTIPLSSARAFESAVQSGDPLVALRSEAEVSSALATDDAESRAYLYPLSNGIRVVAVLFAADREYVDGNALELIAGIASAVLERRSNAALHTQIAPGKAATARSEVASSLAGEPPREVKPRPSWSELSDVDRDIHIRAQRFARVTVAEMELANPHACQAGRAQKDLYEFLKTEIDNARDRYREHFMNVPTMVDYLHIELVRTAAEGDESTLGAEYPGPLA